MLTLLRSVDGDTSLVVAASERSDGDVHPHRVPPDVLHDRQVAASGRPWVLVDQVHGTGVHDRRVGTVREHDAADVLVASRPSEPAMGVWAADCAPVALVGGHGTVVLAHAGWRGLAAGVLDVAIGALGGEPVARAVLGPVIHPCCYPFGAGDAEAVARGVGADLDEVTRVDGALVLDVPAAVAAALAHHGVELDVVGPCTGCDDRWFSHRVRGDTGRHALVVWYESRSDEAGGDG